MKPRDLPFLFLALGIGVCIAVTQVSSCSGSQKAAEKTCGIEETTKVEEILNRQGLTAKQKIGALLVEVGPEYVACVISNSKSEPTSPITADAGSHD